MRIQNYDGMKRYLILTVLLLLGISGVNAQDVGISGGFFASMINLDEESELHVTFTNNSFDTPISPFGAYVQLDFPTTGEYSAPLEPPTGPGAQYFNWTYTAPNIWVGLVNTTIPVLSSHQIIFTVVGEQQTDNTPTILFTDLSSGSDNDPQNNNAQPLLAIQEALPVEFLDFTSKSLDCDHVQLNWSTAIEINNSGFEILYSEDGAHYEIAGFVEGNGNSTSISEYSFIHKLSDKYRNKALLYKLKQVDYSGLFSLSDIVKVDSDCSQEQYHVVMGPNPTNGILNFYFNHPLSQNIEVKIFNSNQQLIESFEIDESHKQFTKNIDEYPSGVFIVKFINGSTQYSKNIVLFE